MLLTTGQNSHKLP